MKQVLINLDRSLDRLQQFRAANGFVPDIERLSAVDGRLVDRQRLIAEGVVDPRLNYSDGALGCALSHFQAWDAARTRGEAMTIIEDDAVLNRHFMARSTAILRDLPADWDCILWGWNFDSPFAVDLLPGVSFSLMKFNQDSLRGNLARYQALDFPSNAFPLLRAFGTLCYSVSPLGAARLIQACRPMRMLSIAVPGLEPLLPNYGVDVMMNAVYPDMKAFAAFPPLAVSPNDVTSSLVQDRVRF